MKYAIFSLPVLAVAAMSFTLPTIDGTVEVNTKESVIEWKGYKVTGSHTGTVMVESGALEFSEGILTGGKFEIDLTSIVCTDLSGNYKEKLEGHLKSADFFDVEQFPTAMLEITEVISRGTPGDYKVVANLTIKGITKEIKFIANINEEDESYVATADLQVDRAEYNVKYGSGSFFKALGDKTIYDEFDLSVKLVANK